MLTAVKSYLRFFKESIKCNLASVLEYKTSFLIQCLFMILNNASFLIFWNVLFSANGGDIKGIGMNDLMFVWGLSSFAFGVANFFFGGSTKLGDYILNGSLDTYLVQPRNVILNVMMSKMDFAACGDMIYGLIVGLVSVNYNIGKYALFILFGIVASLFFSCVSILCRIITIKIGNTDNLYKIVCETMLITFSTYPEEIYGGVVRFLIYTIIPSAYISFVPKKFIATLDVKYLLIFMLAGAVFVISTSLICKRLLKSYESGNTIALRD